MTIRNITLKKLDSKNVIQEIDDKLTAHIEQFHKTETLIKLYQQSLVEDKKQRIKISADKTFAFNATVNNMHRLQKQMRAYQRSHNIRFSSDQSLTHYVYAKRKVKIDTRSVKETSVCNTLKIYHLYEAKNELNAEDFNALKAFIALL